MKKYDGLYIFAGTAKEDVLDKQIDKARGEITRLSGNVLTTEVLGKKTLRVPCTNATTASM
jgi:ribosomal protein S6